MYKINRITGEFVNPETEKIFMEVTWPGISKRLIIALLLCSLNFLASNNIPGPGEFPEYRTIIVPVTKVFAVFLIVIAIVIWKSKRYAAWLRLVVALSEIFIGFQSAANHYFFLSYINNFYDIGTSFIVFYILIFYIVVPNKLLIILFTNVFISVSFAFITNLSGLTSVADIFSISMYFAIANALGYGITLSNNRDRRQEYHQRIQLKEAQNEAMEANKTKSRFLAMINHEMRTPLNVVLGGVQLLKNESLDRKQRDLLSTIRNSGEMLKVLIQNVLDFTSIERHEVTVKSSRFSPEDMTAEIERIYKPIAEESGLDLKATYGDFSFKYLRGDTLKIRQVLTNLLNNAVKFTDKGAVTLEIDELERKNDIVCLRFTVEDTGIGIPEAYFKEILKPFAQVDQSSTRNFDGSGLGLAICSELLEAMDSSLCIKSLEDKGSSFSFEIMFETDDSACDSDTEDGEIGAYRILLIDDIEANLKIVGGLLESLNQTVVSARGSREGMEQIRSDNFDMVIIDLHMPGKNGIETLKEIRAERPDITAFLMTADTRTEVFSKALDAGFTGFIPKPVEISVLRDVLCGTAGGKNLALRETSEQSSGSAVIDMEFILELKKDLGSVTFAEVLGSCIRTLETNADKLSSAGEINAAGSIIHQLKGVAGNYRLSLLNKTLADYKRDIQAFDRQNLSEVIRKTIIELKDIGL